MSDDPPITAGIAYVTGLIYGSLSQNGYLEQGEIPVDEDGTYKPFFPIKMENGDTYTVRVYEGGSNFHEEGGDEFATMIGSLPKEVLAEDSEKAILAIAEKIAYALSEDFDFDRAGFIQEVLLAFRESNAESRSSES